MFFIERFVLRTSKASGTSLTNLCQPIQLKLAHSKVGTKILLQDLLLECKAFSRSDIFVPEISIFKDVTTGTLYIDVGS